MADKTGPQKPDKASIRIIGMTRTTCAATIEKGLSETPGIEQADVNFVSEQASVECDPAKVSLAMKNRRNRSPEFERS